MICTIYAKQDRRDALLKQIVELGHGLAPRLADHAGKYSALICECTEEQAKQIEGMADCGLIGRGQSKEEQ